ncbi:MAG TPA: glycine cleavage T C-terminal barrel domain-containing protein [Vicinamibacterales bacterium]|jgi:folate-binding protein YgfZ|nr:glycine cleavage T C-terminal barrel domain-containing protein [Vicinamibacterales bacterium]
MIPAVSVEAYYAARRGAAFIDRSSRGRIAVSGADRRSYLQGLLTNDIEALKPGRGCYAAYLTAQGRMITDLWVYELGDTILLALSGEVKDVVLARLDQFVFSEDVRLGDVTDAFAEIAVIGPEAAGRLAAALPGVQGGLSEALSGIAEHGNVRFEHDGAALIVTRITDAGEPGYDIYVERSRASALTASLMAAGVVPMDEPTADAVRIEAGVPLFHRDMDEETIPLEAGIESRAISFTKGCYVGQEVIIRVMHRGHGRVARRLAGLRIAGHEVPVRGAVVRAGDREIGRVTSATLSPTLAVPIALAYVHRDFAEPGTNVSVDGAVAQVTPLPFV